jgi:Ca2+:H+ antiporter
MNRWLALLLLAAPAAVLAEALHASPLVTFVLAALGIIPLAGLIGQSTEVLAEHLGQGIGGLLNATFGNAAEIIIGLTALAAGLPQVVQASLAGSIIGNVLLVLGTSMLIGGWRYRRQQFQPRVAGQYAAMLVLAVIGMAIPSLLATIGESTSPGAIVVRGFELHELSIGVAIILLLCYAAYIAYSVFGLRASREDMLSLSTSKSNNDVERKHDTVHTKPPEEETVVRRKGEERNPLTLLARWWSTTLWLPIAVLAGATAVTAVISEVLVSTIEPLTHQVGLSPFFVGLIILPIVGNAAEHFSAITSAYHNHMEITMAITSGSSIQIALLAAPILVLFGALIGVPLDLNFPLFEVGLFALVAALYALISLDGESTWLEGLLLCAFYLILAVSTFFAPIA